MSAGTLDARLARATTADVGGVWQRHVTAIHAASALAGRVGVGRWGTGSGYPVLYLGRPTDSVVVEAYRHLIDPVIDRPAPPVRPRVLITCEVAVTDILDLRVAANQTLCGLTMAQLQCKTSDKPGYRACQDVSAAAYRRGCHGLIAPAATRMGEALVLFTDLLPDGEQPIRTGAQPWPELPPDPRKS